METKVAILRGINVGGKRKILMSDLKTLFQELGFTEISTYIQSGNVIFKSPGTENSQLENEIEKSIENKFGFDVPVIIRTAQELEKLISNNPFYNGKADVNQLHLTFLKEQPKKESIKQAGSQQYEPDEFVAINKNIFIYCNGKYHQSKLTNNFFEKKLSVGATTRNWKTVLKLAELSNKQ